MGLMDKAVLRGLERQGWRIRDATPAELEQLGNFFGEQVAAATIAEMGIDASISVRRMPPQQKSSQET